MAKKKARPDFKLPSTEPGAAPAASPEWVYRSDAEPADAPNSSDPVEPLIAVGPVEPVETDVLVETVMPVEPAWPAESTAASDRLARAREIVGNYSAAAAGAGLIPWPMLDMIALGGLQLTMISALANHYNVPFSRDRGKALLAAVLSAVASRRLACGVCVSMIKFVPVVGTLIAKVAVPGLGSALTYTVGLLFVEHFERGGTLVDFDTARMQTPISDVESTRT